MPKANFALTLFLTLCMCTSCLVAQSFDPIEYDVKVSLDDNLKTLGDWMIGLEENGAFNGSIFIAQDGNRIFSKAYGYVSHTKENKLTVNHSFRLASISKQFTATAIMLLQQDGLLAYDDPVIKHIPDLAWDNVSIRHALTHTSGMPDYEKSARKWNYKVPLTTPDVVNYYKRHPESLRFESGSKFEYSNTAYIILALVVENITNLTFEEFAEKRIFGPLGMTQTRVWNLLSSDTAFVNKALGFNGKKAFDFSPLDGVVGDGGIFASGPDFLKWDQSWYNHSLINKSNVEQAYSPYTLNDGTLSFYGFGLFLTENGSYVDHSGGWVAARTYMRRNLEKRSIFVILDNSTSKILDKISRNIILFLKEGGLM